MAGTKCGKVYGVVLCVNGYGEVFSVELHQVDFCLGGFWCGKCSTDMTGSAQSSKMLETNRKGIGVPKPLFRKAFESP